MQASCSIADLEESLVQVAESRLTGRHAVAGTLRWEPITQGGSDRHFFRVRDAGSKSWVVMRYSDAREENALYTAIARFLRGIGVRAPGILFDDSDRRLIGLDDLGETSLYSLFHEKKAWADVEPAYRAALDEVRTLHRHADAPVRMMNGFDENLYAWERTYFLDNLVVRWAGIRLSDAERDEIQREGSQMAMQLMATPRCLVHRDFQSQNLLVRDDATWMIDFQGMRLGHAAYDVASLLYDPYVSLTPAQRASLLAWYARDKAGSADELEFQLCRAAAQRLMQALGAYGFLGMVKGRREFLGFIPVGLANLGDALEHLDGMKATLTLVRRIQVETRSAI
ncbi:MAG: phosphotransferase [Verrucomicrobia bacterium]|nr:phosphotransferase [Verrucomicrobiota bacterium]